MENPFIGDPFSGDETLIPSLHDDADLLQFLDGLDRHFAAPCPSDESSFDDVLRDTGATAKMHASKSLPDLPMAGKGHGAIEFSALRSMSAQFTAVNFASPHRGLSRVDSDVSNKSVAQGSQISSSVITAAEVFRPPNEPYLQKWDMSWGHSDIHGYGHVQTRQESSTVSQVYDRVVPTIPGAYGPVFSCPPVPKPGGGQRGRAKNTEGWRDKNRRIQKAFRERQKEKQRATEIAIEEMSERVEALEQENRQLQKSLEDATHSVKRSKAAAKDCSTVAVAVTCTDGGDAPLRLTSEELQAATVDRIVDIWGGLVRNMAVCFPEAQRQPNGPHASRLQTLAGEGCALMWALVDVNPAVLASFVGCDLEAAAPRKDISPDMWPSVLKRLQLSPEQCAALAKTRRAMLANVGALLTERENLRAQAQGMALAGGNSSLLAADEAAIVDQLHSNVEAVQLCTSYYISHAYTQILTPMQCASFFHQCYPFGPDLMSLMASAAAAADEPRPADIFREVHFKTGGLRASAEWRKALVLPLSRLRCTAA